MDRAVDHPGSCSGIGAGRPEGAITKAARTLPIPGKSQEAREKVARRSLQIDRITEEAKGALKEAGLDDIQSALLEVRRDKRPRGATEEGG